MIEPRNCFGSAYDVALIGEGPDPDRDLEGEVWREEDLQGDEPRSGTSAVFIVTVDPRAERGLNLTTPTTFF